MSYNHKRNQQHNDDNLPRVFQRLGSFSTTRSNSYNSNNDYNRQHHHYTDEIVDQQRSDVGLRIARYDPSDNNYSNNRKKNNYSSYPDYSKISQLNDNAIYYTPNKNNNNDNNNYQQRHYQQSPVVSNPPAPKNSFSFVRSESPKEISRPIISFLRDNNNNPPPNNNDSNNNVNFYYNNDQQQQQQYHAASPASVYSDLSVDYTPKWDNNSSDIRVVIDDTDDDNDSRKDESDIDDSRPQSYSHNKMGKNILITASLPSSLDKNGDDDDDNTHEKQVAITTSTRKVTVAKPTVKRDHSSRSPPPSTKIYRQSSSSPPPRYNKRTRSYPRSPSPRRPRHRPRHLPSPPIDSDEKASFLRLETDLYTPNYEPSRRRSEQEEYTHIRDAVNDRVSSKPKDLRSYPPLGSSDIVLIRKNAAAAASASSTPASSKPKDLRSYPPFESSDVVLNRKNAAAAAAAASTSAVAKAKDLRSYPPLGSSTSSSVPAPAKKDLRSYPPLGSSTTASPPAPPKKDLRSYPPLGSSDPSAAARRSSYYSSNTNNAAGSPVSHNKVWVKPSKNNQKPVPVAVTTTSSRPSSSSKKTGTTPVVKKPATTTSAAEAVSATTSTARHVISKPVNTPKPINSKPAAISKSVTTTPVGITTKPISHKIITNSTTIVKEKLPVADSSSVVNTKRNSALDNKSTDGTSVNTTVKHGTHQNTSDNITKANHSPVNHDKTPVKPRRVFTDGPPVPQAQQEARQQAPTSRQQEQERRQQEQDQEAIIKAALLKEQQKKIEKDKKAKELLRQLAIDERDDIVMDIMPSAPLVSSLSSRVVINRRHSDCRNNNNSNTPKTVTLKQEPMNEDPPVNVIDSNINSHNGVVVEAVVQQETSIPEPTRKEMDVAQMDNNTALREAMDHVELLADTIMNGTDQIPDEDTAMTEPSEEMNDFLPVTKMESPSPAVLKDKIRNAKTPPPIITDTISNEQQLISPPASSHKEELEETPLPPAPISTLPPSIIDTPSTKKKRLPPPWKVKMTDLGDIYYHNHVTGEDRVTRPVA